MRSGRAINSCVSRCHCGSILSFCARIGRSAKRSLSTSAFVPRAAIVDEEWRAIHDAFLRHSVIFFREQNAMAPAQQVALGRRFGALHIHPAAPHLDGYPEVFVIHANKDSKIVNGELWHSDVSCEAE